MIAANDQDTVALSTMPVDATPAEICADGQPLWACFAKPLPDGRLQIAVACNAGKGSDDDPWLVFEIGGAEAAAAAAILTVPTTGRA